jgi:hypothetical protein
MKKMRSALGNAQFAAEDVATEDVAVAIDFRADAPGFAVVWKVCGVVLGHRPLSLICPVSGENTKAGKPFKPPFVLLPFR